MNKKQSRIRRSRKTRANILQKGKVRLSVFRTSKHIYAQVIDETGSKVLATASTVQKAISSTVDYTGNIDAASAVGKAIAEKANAAGIKVVAFDRSGFKYHGRVKALAEAARENGLEF